MSSGLGVGGVQRCGRRRFDGTNCAAALMSLVLGATALALPPLASAGSAVLEQPATGGGYHRLRLPLAVQSQALHADLRDVQVLDARGQPLPFAWLQAERSDETAPAATPVEQAVPFFPTPAPPTPRPTGAANATPPPAAPGGWIVDARAITGTLLAVQVALAPEATGIFELGLDASDDLQSWQPLRAGTVSLLRLQREGLTLASTRIEFDGSERSLRYLRLQPRVGSAPLPLVGVTAVSVAAPLEALPPLQWTAPFPPTTCTAQHCDYALPRHLPLDRLALTLATPDTLAAVQWLTLDAVRDDGADARDDDHRYHRHHHHGHRLRDVLRALHDKDVPAPRDTRATDADDLAADFAAGWRPLAADTVWRLRTPQGESSSPPLPLDGGAYAGLRLRPRGGMAQLGATAPQLAVATPAVELVFLAREPAPFRLVWGADAPAAAAPALSLAELMPLRQTGEALPASAAVVALPAALQRLVLADDGTAATASVRAGASGNDESEAAPATRSTRRLWLWGVLLVALAAMGAMAWSLLRPSSESPSRPRQPEAPP